MGRSTMANRDRVLRAVAEATQHLGKRFWDVKAAVDDAGNQIGELYIYGPIYGTKFFDDEVSPGAIRDEIAALGEITTLHVYINSPGGDPWAGHAIYNLLRRQDAEVVVHVDGIAASAASLVAMAGDRILIPPNGTILIHKSWSIMIGNADDMRAIAEELDKVDLSMLAVYREQTGLSDERLNEMLAKETLLVGQEAVDLGFADELEQTKQVAASIRDGRLVVNGVEMDISAYRSADRIREALGVKANGTSTVGDLNVNVRVTVTTDNDDGSGPPEPPKDSSCSTGGARKRAPLSLLKRRVRVNERKWAQ